MATVVPVPWTANYPLAWIARLHLDAAAAVGIAGLFLGVPLETCEMSRASRQPRQDATVRLLPVPNQSNKADQGPGQHDQSAGDQHRLLVRRPTRRPGSKDPT